MIKIASKELKTPNASRHVTVQKSNLPLHCPMKGDSLWNSHPRVYIPIEDAPDGKMICPYCGTAYSLRG